MGKKNNKLNLYGLSTKRRIEIANEVIELLTFNKKLEVEKVFRKIKSKYTNLNEREFAMLVLGAEGWKFYLSHVLNQIGVR